MLAVFKTGGKQYSVKAGQILKVEKLEGKKGDNISFKDILAVSDDKINKIGTPLVEGAQIEAKILDQIRDKKIIVFKKRKRQNYRSTQGHRQSLTVLKIESISLGSKKIISEKKENDKVASSKVTDDKKKVTPKKTTETKKTIKAKDTKKTVAKKNASVKKTAKKTVKKVKK
tara:strand:- start:161 stop:676 length:516 start_codon:yes stop_codon:yes gene_type:complete